MPREEENYVASAGEDANEAVAYFLDEIVDAVIENEGEVDTEITDWSDSYHHEAHVDRAYSLLEAATLLDQLDDFEETDSGLWEGQSPRDAISTQAAFTYGNAVASMFSDTMKEINEAIEEAEIEWDPPEDTDEKAWREGLERKIRHIIYKVAGVGEPPTPKGKKEWRPGP